MTPRLRRALLIATAPLVLLAAACNPLANPEGWATPLFTNGTLYYFPDQDTLLAVEVGEEGPEIATWEFPNTDLPAEENVDIEAVYTVPIVDGDTIYFAGWEGHVYAVSTSDGRLEWSTREAADITGSIVSGLVLHDGVLYFGTTEGQLYAIDAQTGQHVEGWDVDEHTYGKGIWATPILQGDTLYIGTMDGEVHAITLPGGEPAWDEPFTAATGAVPELALLEEEGLLWVPTIGKTVYLVDPATGEPQPTELQSENWVWTTPVLRDGIAYYGDFAGFVHGVDIRTGDELWVQQVGDKVKSAPVLIDNMLVVADRSSTISFLDVENEGEIENAVHRDDAGTFRANLVARDGVAYALGTSGTLFRADPVSLRVVPLEITGAPD